jgi:hypothetical protein
MKLLGDAIHDVIEAFGFAPKKPCDPCKKRQEALNRAHQRAREKLRGKGKR